MSCPSRTSGRPFTANQKAQLVGLLRAGALSRDTGKPVDQVPMAAFDGVRSWPANPVVIGALRDRELAASRPVRRDGRSWTEYWLTDAGAVQARALVETADVA